MWQHTLMVYYGLAAYDHHPHNKKLKEAVIPRPLSYIYVLGWKSICVQGIWEVSVFHIQKPFKCIDNHRPKK